ncbi:hypothetical protein CYG48_17960 (plasmid) [Neorhizobium sp. SOG26]|uniref:hypothetical protein n=1 Tax=Neorhizobium sp. SOG26 TaxID=2060726 RepID=UPI000E596BDC|nr:hypothetical protein [Neorhizobium sp. SOG26]AXV17705.1 hypothetical protein CYG48_17960 [Neorhizobium sp. SOG26]
MTTMDKITEDISHFIGLFQLAVEEAQLRNAYGDFSYYASKHHLNSQPFVPDAFEAPYDFVGFDPEVNYKAPSYTAPLWHPKLSGDIAHPPIPTVGLDDSQDVIDHPDHLFLSAQLGRASLVRTIEPPGSVANYLVQAASLSDDDTFSVGGSGMVFSPEAIDKAEILEAARDALDASPLREFARPGSTTEIIDLIDSIAAELRGLAAAPLVAPEDAGNQPLFFVKQSDVLTGTYVNGQIVTVAPVLKDYFSPEDETDEEDAAAAEDEPRNENWEDDGPEPNVVVSPDGSITIDDRVEFVGGNNVAVNEAVVNNLWTGATVTAVVGNHVEVNAIVQTNVIQDSDAITSALEDWTKGDVPTELFNIATFERTDPLEDNADVAAATSGFPSAWAVAEIKGDLVITNWLEQYIFMSDNDIGILSSSGVTTNVIAGDNTSANHTSIFELSKRYDLIIVGGSLYDASIIHQTNILFDNDVVGAVAGFETAGHGTVSHGSNLLWNEALIRNVGGGDRFGDMSEGYAETAQDFASGAYRLHSDVLTDPSFAGRGALSVLYVSGDLVNIQYIKQTAILGDSDQIALAMKAVRPDSDAEWSIATGGNTLINAAAIVDLDSFGRTYVGGEQYSQETLFQAELITHRPELLGLDPNVLVNEAVLFLDDAMLNDGAHATDHFTPPLHDAQYQHDGMQHMLG